MSIYRPNSVLAGFHADLPAPTLPELTHVGEEWIPTDYRIPDHVHPVWEFYFQIDGQTQWIVSGRQVKLVPGALLAVPPNVRHRLVTPTTAAHHFFFAGIDIDKVLTPAKPATEWRRTRAHFVRHVPEIAPSFRQLIREVTMKAPFREEALALSLKLLALELTRCLRSTPISASLALRHPAVVRARELIDHQPARAWTVQALAIMAGLSPSRLAGCFKAEVGMTLHQYLMRARVDAARTLLGDTDLPITAIALELGYASSQHFSAAYKAATGHSPTASRRKKA
jgi:AraC-like DNA-binding protein